MCVENLLLIQGGEVPYERIKGINPRVIDAPISEAEVELKHDAEALIETYEPRVDVVKINVARSAAVSGGFSVTADIKEKEG